jgi:hypothetical protein
MNTLHDDKDACSPRPAPKFDDLNFAAHVSYQPFGLTASPKYQSRVSKRLMLTAKWDHI